MLYVSMGRYSHLCNCCSFLHDHENYAQEDLAFLGHCILAFTCSLSNVSGNDESIWGVQNEQYDLHDVAADEVVGPCLLLQRWR